MNFLYAGSFDPLTKGHEWVIRNAPRPLTVLVANNPTKKSLFTLEQRVNMVIQFANYLFDVQVWHLQPDEYLAAAAARHKANYIVRGARNSTDFEYERAYAEVNAGIASGVKHLVMLPPPELASISSSVVKALVGPKGWETVVAKYVNHHVLEALRGSAH